jgi:hypothetical protein
VPRPTSTFLFGFFFVDACTTASATLTGFFEVQRLRPTSKRMLGSSICRLERHRHETGNRADVHDPSGNLLAHRGKDRLRHSHYAEKISLEDRHDLSEA